MRFTTSFLYCLVLCTVCMQLHAQGSISSPYSEVKGNVVISEFHALDKPTSAEGIFLNALLWMIENRELENTEEEDKSTFEIDYDKSNICWNLRRLIPKVHLATVVCFQSKSQIISLRF